MCLCVCHPGLIQCLHKQNKDDKPSASLNGSVTDAVANPITNSTTTNGSDRNGNFLSVNGTSITSCSNSSSNMNKNKSLSDTSLMNNIADRFSTPVPKGHPSMLGRASVDLTRGKQRTSQSPNNRHSPFHHNELMHSYTLVRVPVIHMAQ